MSKRIISSSSVLRATLIGIGMAAAIAMVDAGSAQAQVPLSWSGDYYLPVRGKEHSASDEDSKSQRRASTYRPNAQRSNLAGPSSDEDTPAPRRSKPKGVRVASIGRDVPAAPKPRKSLSGGGGIHWLASSGCLDGHLRSVLSEVASRYGSVTVNSTCRSKSHNASVGGAPRSMHLTGNAVDFRIHGNYGAAASYMRGQVGGFKHYGGGLFHIDTGPKRTW